MAIQDDKTILSKQDLKEYHNRILPYLGGNMMMSTNNSDFYSTDEKVVGVWTDGRPLYQKTFYKDSFTVLANNETVIELGDATNCNLLNAFGSRGGTTSFPMGYPDFGIWGAILNNKFCLDMVRVGNSLTITNTYMTFQYTKTTDTASTALTTPGAYDINFPNTWPANKEIYFGNGLYGYRKTGTITAAKNAPDNTIIMTGLQNGSIINWGCNWIDADGNQMGAGCYREDTVQSLVQLNKTSLNGQLFFSTNDNTGARTNAPYDVWVTYTK